MKNIIKISFQTLIVCFLLLYANITNGQSVLEKLGGAITHFKIKSDTIVLNNSKQLLIKRGVEKSNYDNVSNSNYGYERFHLEFISDKQLFTKRIHTKRRKGSYYYHITFLNEEGITYRIQLSNSDVVFREGTKGEEKHYIYSISFENIPLIQLEDTVEINIVRKRNVY